MMSELAVLLALIYSLVAQQSSDIVRYLVQQWTNFFLIYSPVAASHNIKKEIVLAYNVVLAYDADSSSH